MDESKLIIRAQNGEKEAFQSLIINYYPYVSKFLIKLTGDKVISEDLTQDTFVSLIHGIEKYDVHGTASFSTYVMAIAKNLYIDYLRRNKRTVLSVNEQVLQSEINLEDSVLQQMQIQEVMQMLDTLSEEQAIPIRLKYLEQFTLVEIAERFNCEPKTIKSRIHNGVVKLQKLLERRNG